MESYCGIPDTESYFSSCYNNQDGCEDIDECAEETHQCSPMATCVNSPGSYNCGCQFGLLGSGITCHQQGYYENNQMLWERLGQDATPSNSQGLVQFNTFGEDFAPPSKAGVASWVFTDAAFASRVHKALYGLANSVDELLKCSQCLGLSRISQEQCPLGIELGSIGCVAANGIIRLASMALVEQVKCRYLRDCESVCGCVSACVDV